MVFHKGEELDRGHLKGDSDVLIGVNHDDVVFFVAGGKKGSAVVGGDLYILGELEIFMGKVGYPVVYLYALGSYITEVCSALLGVGACAHSEDKYIRRIGLFRH